jgi:hypothetical protein
MSKSKELMGLCEEVDVLYSGTSSTKTRTQNRTQFTADGNAAQAVGRTKPKLEAGVYRFMSTMSGVLFEKHEFATDELLRFKDLQYEEVIKEIGEFWKMRDAFKQFGYTHSRGMVLEGLPGTGKSCLIKIIMEQIVGEGDIVFSVKDTYSLVEGLKTFREVEPERKAFVVLEDIDGMIDYASAEHSLLELLDGDSQVDGIMYIATTNHIDRLPARVLRPGRFDKIINIGFPAYEGRLEYLKHKLAKYESESTIADLAEKTDGLGFNHLKEMILCTYVFKEQVENVIARLRGTVPNSMRDSYVERRLKECLEFVESVREDKEKIQDADLVKSALATRIDKLGFEGVTIESVEISADGDVIVAFKDEENNEMEVLFGVDYSGSAYAMVLDNYGDNEDIVIVDLDPVAPTVFENEFGTLSLDLVNLGWLNTTTVDTILRSGDIIANINGIPPEEEEVDSSNLDAFGNKIVNQSNGESFAVKINKIGEEVVERVISRIVRGGRQLRLPILRAESRVNLTFKQRESITKAKKESKSRFVHVRRKPKV